MPRLRTDRSLWYVRMSALYWALDVLAAVCATLTAYAVRFHAPLATWVPVTKGMPELDTYAVAGCALGVMWTLAFRADGLYDARGARALEVWPLVRGTLVGTTLAVAVSFFVRGTSYSRVVLPLTWLFGTCGVIVFRRAVTALVRRATTEAWTRLAVVGATPLGVEVAMRIARHPMPGHAFLGVLVTDETPVPAHVPVLGHVADLASLAETHALNHLLVTLPALRDAHTDALLRVLHARGVDVEIVPDVSAWMPAQPVLTMLDGVPLIGLRESPLSGWRIALKRVVDLAVSSVLLVLAAPVLVCLALLVWMDAGRPVLYAQERIGRDLRPFTLYKFRTMREDAEGDGRPRRAVRDDPRRTRLGRWLRRYSLDELPQLWNVLRGDMSLVGPRPERPAFVRELEDAIPEYFRRHRVKSGLTGWAQIHDLRGDAPFDERTRYDLYYVENWSLGLDLRIVWRTVGAVLASRHAV